MNIIETMDDPKLFAKHFAGQTWDAWRAFLAALFALPMNADQLALSGNALAGTSRRVKPRARRGSRGPQGRPKPGGPTNP